MLGEVVVPDTVVLLLSVTFAVKSVVVLMPTDEEEGLMVMAVITAVVLLLLPQEGSPSIPARPQAASKARFQYEFRLISIFHNRPERFNCMGLRVSLPVSGWNIPAGNLSRVTNVSW